MKNNKNNQLTVKSNVQKSLDVINSTLDNLGINKEAKNLTSGSFKLNENDSNNVNIHTCIDLTYLLKCVAVLMNMKAGYEAAASALKLKTYPNFMWLGYPYESWINDLKLRINLVVNSTKITELNAAKKELETFLTSDERLDITMNKIKNLLQ